MRERRGGGCEGEVQLLRGFSGHCLYSGRGQPLGCVPSGPSLRAQRGFQTSHARTRMAEPLRARQHTEAELVGETMECTATDNGGCRTTAIPSCSSESPVGPRSCAWLRVAIGRIRPQGMVGSNQLRSFLRVTGTIVPRSLALSFRY